jgi:hypothetical protein
MDTPDQLTGEGASPAFPNAADSSAADSLTYERSIREQNLSGNGERTARHSGLPPIR